MQINAMPNVMVKCLRMEYALEVAPFAKIHPKIEFADVAEDSTLIKLCHLSLSLSLSLSLFYIFIIKMKCYADCFGEPVATNGLCNTLVK